MWQILYILLKYLCTKHDTKQERHMQFLIRLNAKHLSLPCLYVFGEWSSRGTSLAPQGNTPLVTQRNSLTFPQTGAPLNKKPDHHSSQGQHTENEPHATRTGGWKPHVCRVEATASPRWDFRVLVSPVQPRGEVVTCRGPRISAGWPGGPLGRSPPSRPRHGDRPLPMGRHPPSRPRLNSQPG